MRIYYAGVRFTRDTNSAIHDFRVIHSLQSYPKPSMRFHSTVAYSRKPFHLIQSIPQERIGIAGDRIELWSKSLVLPFESKWLTMLHESTLYYGAVWDHPTFTPHITVADGVEDTFIIPELTKYRIPIEVLEIFYSEWEQS